MRFMEDNRFFDQPVRVVLKLLALAALGYAMWLSASVWTYLIMGLAFGSIMAPVVRRLSNLTIRNHSVGKTPAAILTLLGFLLVVGLLSALFVPLLVRELSYYRNINVSAIETELIRLADTHLDHFDAMAWIENNQREIVGKAVSGVGSLTSILGTVVSGATSVFSTFFAMIFVGFFFMQDPQLLRRTVAGFFPKTFDSWANKALDDIRTMLGSYLVGLLIQMLIFFGMVALGLWLVGMPSVILVATLAALLNVIPYLGPALGMLAAFILSFAHFLPLPPEFSWLMFSLKIVGVFIIAQMIDNNLVQPYLFSKSANLHPLEVFFSILLAGTFFGLIGVIFGAPLWSALKIAVSAYHNRTLEHVG
jgi:predicted PurR-regulated permease PerM